MNPSTGRTQRDTNGLADLFWSKFLPRECGVDDRAIGDFRPAKKGPLLRIRHVNPTINWFMGSNFTFRRPFGWFNRMDKSGSVYAGRGAITHWKRDEWDGLVLSNLVRTRLYLSRELQALKHPQSLVGARLTAPSS